MSVLLILFGDSISCVLDKDEAAVVAHLYYSNVFNTVKCNILRAFKTSTFTVDKAET